jgi:uncharacterized membrane protein YfcA
VLWHVVVIGVAGFSGGFIGSQVGAGSVTTLPALLLAGLPLPLAVGTNALSGWLVNVIATTQYWRAGKVNPGFVLPLSLAAAAGAYLGAQLLFLVDVAVLAKVFAVLLAALGIAVLLEPHDRASIEVRALRGGRLWLGLLLAFGLGVYGGIISVGLTTFAILALTLFLRQSRIEAVANAIVLSAVLLTASTLYFVVRDKIYYPYAIPLAVTSMIGSYAGARVALGERRVYFKVLLIAIIVLVAAKLLTIG